MRFVNYFNDAANAAVAFSFHRGFVAVSYLHVPKKRKKKKKEISCSNYCCLVLFIPWFDAIGSSKWLIKVKSNKKKGWKYCSWERKKLISLREKMFIYQKLKIRFDLKMIVSPLEKDDLHSMNVGIEELLIYYCEWYTSDEKKFLIKKVY